MATVLGTLVGVVMFPSDQKYYAFWNGFRAFGSWCGVLAFVGLGMRYLGFNTRALGYARVLDRFVPYNRNRNSTRQPGEKMNQFPEARNTAQVATSRPQMRRLLPSILVNAVLPYLVYQALTGRGYSILTALTIAAVLPAVGTLAGWIRTRRLDGIGLISLIFIVIGIVTSFISGDIRFLLIKDSFLTGTFGVVCLISLLLPRPLMFYFGRQFMSGGDPELAARYDALWQYQAVRRANRLITTVWGFGLLAEALLRVLLLSVLPIPTFLLISPMMVLAVTAGLILWTLTYGRGRARQRAEQAQAEHPSDEAA